MLLSPNRVLMWRLPLPLLLLRYPQLLAAFRAFQQPVWKQITPRYLRIGFLPGRQLLRLPRCLRSLQQSLSSISPNLQPTLQAHPPSCLVRHHSCPLCSSSKNPVFRRHLGQRHSLSKLGLLFPHRGPLELFHTPLRFLTLPNIA